MNVKLAVIGGGYVGTAAAVSLAQRGHEVFLAERDEARLALLKSGTLPFYEPGLLEAFSAAKITCVRSVKEAGEGLRCVFVCVGTPEGAGGAADLTQLFSAEKALRSLPKTCVVAVRSTVPPGTCDALERRLWEQGCRAPVAFVPEFLAQGRALEGENHPARVVLGTRNGRGEETLREIFAGERIFQMSRVEAELTKLCANGALAVRLAFMGEAAQLCETVGADMRVVAEAVGADPRIGREYLDAGAGFGGSCLPKDGAALIRAAQERDAPMEVLSAALFANRGQRRLLLNMLRRYYRSVCGLRVAVLGLAFKPETDDLRGSAAVETVETLLLEGAEVCVWDRAAGEAFERKCPAVKRAETPEEALAGAHACLIFTAWREIRQMRAEVFCEKMAAPLVLDGRGCFSPEEMERCGATYEAIGRKRAHRR